MRRFQLSCRRRVGVATASGRRPLSPRCRLNVIFTTTTSITFSWRALAATNGMNGVVGGVTNNAIAYPSPAEHPHLLKLSHLIPDIAAMFNSAEYVHSACVRTLIPARVNSPPSSVAFHLLSDRFACAHSRNPWFASPVNNTRAPRVTPIRENAQSTKKLIRHYMYKTSQRNDPISRE